MHEQAVTVEYGDVHSAMAKIVGAHDVAPHDVDHCPRLVDDLDLLHPHTMPDRCITSRSDRHVPDVSRGSGFPPSIRRVGLRTT